MLLDKNKTNEFVLSSLERREPPESPVNDLNLEYNEIAHPSKTIKSLNPEELEKFNERTKNSGAI
jgi:hypothetical protein